MELRPTYIGFLGSLLSGHLSDQEPPSFGELRVFCTFQFYLIYRSDKFSREGMHVLISAISNDDLHITAVNSQLLKNWLMCQFMLILYRIHIASGA